MESDPETINAICELLFQAMTAEASNDYLVEFAGEFDPSTRVAYFKMVFSQDRFPSHLRGGITPTVERQVAAFFRDLNVVVKAVDLPKVGRCFAVHMPGKLRGASWDEIIGRRKPSGEKPV